MLKVEVRAIKRWPTLLGRASQGVDFTAERWLKVAVDFSTRKERMDNGVAERRLNSVPQVFLLIINSVLVEKGAVFVFE